MERDETHWSVTINSDGQDVLTIGHNMLAGADVDADLVRQCAYSLLSFIGDPHPLSAASKTQAAFEEIRWLFEDKQDIDNHGGPNDAMRAVQIIDDALKQPA